MSFNSRDFKGFTFRSGPVKKTKDSFSSFWMDENNDDYNELFGSENKPKGKDLVKMASLRRAIANFVNIVTNESIPVTFNSKDESFTDGKKVVLGANLDDKNFDVAVGLALHEGSHIKLSDFDFLRHLETNIPQEIYLLAETVGVDRYTVISTVKSLLNYIEDRRIDSFVFRTSPGYKGYYHSMYNKYFYSKNVDKGLLSAEFRTETIESYMFRIINLHNKNRQLGSLKGLKEIYETIDLGRIQKGLMRDTNEAFNVACDVMSLVLLNINPIKPQTNDDSSESQESQNGQGQSGDGSSDNTLSDEQFDDLLDAIENGDIESSEGSSSNGKSVSLDVPIGDSVPSENMSNDDGSEPITLSDRQKSLLKKAFEKQEKFIDGDIKKSMMSKKDKLDIAAIEESGATYENVGKDVPKNYWGGVAGNGTKCLVIKNFTQGLVDSDQFSCINSWNKSSYDRYEKYNFVEEGLRLGTVLGRKLQVRSEERSLKYTRKDTGKIDKRLIAELGFGNTNVFSQTFVDRYNKAYLHISVDASGSMSGSKWNKAMTSAVAMIKAADMSGTIDVVLSIRTTHSSRRGGSDVPLILVAYDSRKDKLVKVKNLFPYLNVAGTTPEGLCFEAITKDLIPGNSSQDSYFINFSDGQPYYGNKDIQYQGSTAESHTRKQVENMKAMGMNVLSYFISDCDYESDQKSFKTMYGKDASFINATNMMQVAKTMNDKFLEK